jgi:hypothetical protein
MPNSPSDPKPDLGRREFGATAFRTLPCEPRHLQSALAASHSRSRSQLRLRLPSWAHRLWNSKAPSGSRSVSAPQVTSRHGLSVSFVVVVLLLTPLVGCGGDDDGAQSNPVAGTYVGKVRGTGAFVAVVTSPAREGQDRRDVTVYVCDARRICELFSGSASGDDFEASADSGDAQANGKLSAKAVTGTIELADRKPIRYKASQATATAGLYDLTVSSNGRLRGASAAGVGLTGRSTAPRPGTGTIKLADGKRVRFDVTRYSADDPIRLRAGQVQLIVLSGGQLRGAGKSRRTAGRGDSDFFLRSSR